MRIADTLNEIRGQLSASFTANELREVRGLPIVPANALRETYGMPIISKEEENNENN